MSFATDAELRSYFAGLQLRQGSLPGWEVTVPVANAWAANQIYSTLLPRGYSGVQVAAWDSFKSTQLSLGVWKLLSGADLSKIGLTQQQVDSFDLREELKTTIVTTSNAVVDPTELPGQPATGTIAGESDDELHRRGFDARPSWEFDRNPTDTTDWGW